ncbi:POTRA domain-containing protein [Fulvivirgaceae bacterium BMA10]|uniref:POTRA domain-containing protein n=1 Tax=Splendidivirga corallicola TaxID=3051826 RepID=A0ABT8KJS4_9BACT|nr:POTRA domain-containing protein [Fulvivirgaceae bacterium BMA10]
MKIFISAFILISLTHFSEAQIRYGQQDEKPEVNYRYPGEYKIGGIKVKGTSQLDHNALISLSGLRVGDNVKIPGDAITGAIKKLWNQGIMDDVSIHIEKIESNKVYLILQVKERPRLTRITFDGISKSHQDQLRSDVGLIIGRILTNATVKNAENVIKNFFKDKGFLGVEVNVARFQDSLLNNGAGLHFDVKKGNKVKIDKIHFIGNDHFSPRRLKKHMSETKEKVRFGLIGGLFNGVKKSISKNKEDSLISNPHRGIRNFLHEHINLNILSSSKLIKETFEEDKRGLIAFYNSKGYRDARMVKDTIYFTKDNDIEIRIEIDEGKKYYFRDIYWSGNYKYEDKVLSDILGIEKGEVYNLDLLNQRINYNPMGRDVSALYMDDGYLQFHVRPVEVLIENDSIDIEMRVFEGEQFTISDVIIKGNDQTSDHVIRREIKTLPGKKFSRTDLVRSNQSLAQLGYFDPQQIGMNPIINPEDGTVDIEYTVVEKSGTEAQLSAGFGGNSKLFGTLGLKINNFSARKFFKFKGWQGLPIGDGQTLQISAQSNGSSFQNYSMTFLEPWLGGKKPNALSFNLSHVINRLVDIENNTLGSLKLYSATIGLGTRLKWPDDHFNIQNSITYSLYEFNNYNNSLGITDGNSHSMTFNTTISRYSLDNPLYPKSGSTISLKASFTPPYSLFNKKDYSSIGNNEKYKFAEYHKWDFDASFFTPLAGDLVLHFKTSLGFLGSYSSETGIGPFERYRLGGSGIGSTGDFLVGSQPISLRGYENNSIVPFDSQTQIEGGVVFNKFTFELRYPISLGSPMIYVLGFVEAGNTWNNYKEYNPNQLFKTAGVGVRINMPGFGLMGIDYGHAFDTKIGNLVPTKNNFTFTIGGQNR